MEDCGPTVGRRGPVLSFAKKDLVSHKTTQKQTSEMEVLQFLGHHTGFCPSVCPVRVLPQAVSFWGTGIKSCTVEGAPYPSPPAALLPQGRC